MEITREGVAILLNDVWHSAVVGFECVSSRILWIESRFSRIKICVVVVYGPNEEEDGEERDRSWNDMDRTVNSVGNGYRLCILGDQNGWIRDRTRAGITGAFGVPGENDNGRRGVEFCEERGLCVEIKSMIDLVLVKRDMLRYVQNMRAVRGMGMRPLRSPCCTV